MRKRSSLLPFNPLLDNVILRSHSRVRNADELSKDAKFPIILPKKEHEAKPYITKYHHEMQCYEIGVNCTIDHLQEIYLVVHVRQKCQTMYSIM